MKFHTKLTECLVCNENKLAKARKMRKPPGALSLKKFGPGNIWVKKSFLGENSFVGQKSFLGQKCFFGSKRVFWVKKYFWVKKKLVKKKYC